MGEVVDIRSKQPHLTGKCICMDCKHEWVGVSEIGTPFLECPKCSMYKGVYKNGCAPDVAHQCDCGNMHFWITPNGGVCTFCGLTPNI